MTTPPEQEELVAALKVAIRAVIREAFGIAIARPQLLDMRTVCEQTGIGRSTIYLLIKRGAFPRPFKPTTGADNGLARWLASEVDDWILGLERADEVEPE